MRRGIRIIQASALASVLWLGPSTAGRAQTLTDPTKVDILGFHLGMLPDEVKAAAQKNIDNATFETQQGTLSMGQYKSDPLVFGVEVSTGRDAGLGPEPDKEYMYFIFDLKPPYKTLYIERQHAFSDKSAPTVKGLFDSLVEKYGQPTTVNLGGGASDEFVWTYGSKVPSKEMLGNTTCDGAIGFPAGFAYGLYQGSLNPNLASNLPRCGTWLRVKMSRMSSNPQIVSRFTIVVGDLAAMTESESYIFDVLKKGANGVSAEGQTKAGPNKPRL